MQNIFGLISTALTIYAFICLIRVFMSWIPGSEFSNFGQIISKITDPYLSIFRKIRFLRFGMLDLSAAFGLCILWGLSYIFRILATGQTFSIGFLLVIVVSLIWEIFSSLLKFFLVVLIIRLIVLLVSNKSSYGTNWETLDRSISPLLFRMTSLFIKGNSISFKAALVIGIIELLVIIGLFDYYLIPLFLGLLGTLPF